MMNFNTIMISLITLYSLIILTIYWRKYINKEQREFKKKEDKKKLLFLIIPIILFTLHFSLQIFVNFYNDITTNLIKGYDQRFYIINDSKFDKKFAINLFDKSLKTWVPYYRSNEYRISPITNIPQKSECKLFVYLNKNEYSKYDKISFIYLNDDFVKNDKKRIKLNDTLMNAITFQLPSPPLKIYSIDFESNLPTKKIKINNTFEYIKFVFYIALIGFFAYFIMMSSHQYLKYLYWILNVIGISACIYMIYENTVYFVVLYNLF